MGDDRPKGYTPPTFHTAPNPGDVSLGLGRSTIPRPPLAQRAKAHGYIPFIANVHGTEDHIAVVLHRKGSNDKPYIEIVPYEQGDHNIPTMIERIDTALEGLLHQAHIR